MDRRPAAPFTASVAVTRRATSRDLPAVADAIHDAVGIRLYQTPFTPERVLAALRQTSEGGVN